MKETKVEIQEIGLLPNDIKNYIDNSINGIIEDCNKIYFIDVKENKLNDLKYYIKDSINFYSGFYRKLLKEESKELKENKINYVLDEIFYDNNGKYLLIIINQKECSFNSTSFKLYFELK